MLALKNAGHIEEIIVRKPEDQDFCCPKCKKPMKFYKTGNPRHLVTFEGIYRVKFELYRCENAGCDQDKPIKGQSSKIIPGTSFGADVLHFILRERWKYNQTLDQVLMRLIDDKNVQISRSWLADLFNIEEDLLAEKAVEKAKQRIKKQGKILLSIDGMGTRPGYECIYAFRDALTDMTLLVAYLPLATADKLRELILKVKSAYNVPIIGVISDKAENIVHAVAEELPGVPHGYCRFHFLKNAATPVNKIDHDVRAKIQKDVGAISTITTLEKKRRNSRTPSTRKSSRPFWRARDKSGGKGTRAPWNQRSRCFV